MLIVNLPVMNDQAAALARTLPKLMEKLMESAEDEESPNDAMNDATKVRAVLGELLSQSYKHVRLLGVAR